MKRVHILLISSALLLSSCNTLVKTARTAEVAPSLKSATVVDIVPATDQRITYTLEPTKALQRGGVNNIKQAVEAEALAKNGNADALLEPQYVITKRQGLFGSKVTSITVSGRPVYYQNFRTLNDTVWCNPAFRGVNLYAPQHGSGLFAKKETAGYTAETHSTRPKGFDLLVNPFVGGKYVYNSGGDGYYDDYIDDYYFAGSLWLSVGYQFNPYLFVGAGVGLDPWRGDVGSIPLYFNPRIYFSEKEKGVFVDAKLGSDAYSEFESLFIGASIGYSFGRLDAAIQYLYYEGTYGYHDAEECRQCGLSVSYRF